MEQKYLDIIRFMRIGKRFNTSQVARKLNLPTSTVSDRVKKIEEDFTIKRVSLLDYPKLGYLANAKLAIKTTIDVKDIFLDFLKQQQCVNSIYHVNSGFDFLIDVIFKDAAQLKNWIDSTRMSFGVEIIKFTILKTETKEGFLP